MRMQRQNQTHTHTHKARTQITRKRNHKYTLDTPPSRTQKCTHTHATHHDIRTQRHAPRHAHTNTKTCTITSRTYKHVHKNISNMRPAFLPLTPLMPKRRSIQAFGGPRNRASVWDRNFIPLDTQAHTLQSRQYMLIRIDIVNQYVYRAY